MPLCSQNRIQGVITRKIKKTLLTPSRCRDRHELACYVVSFRTLSIQNLFWVNYTWDTQTHYFLEKVTQEVPLRCPTYEFPEATAWSAQNVSPQACIHEFPEVNTRSSNLKSNGVSHRISNNLCFYVVREDKASHMCASVLYERLS